MRLPSLALLVLGVCVAPALGQTPQGNAGEGDRLYTERCAKCHESGVPRAPVRLALSRLTPDAIRSALTTGSMRSQGAELTQAQIELLARTVGTATATAANNNTCTTAESSWFADPFDRPNWDGWGGNIAQHRFQAAAAAQLPASQVSRLKLKWAFGFPGANRAFAQPTVAAGRVFVGSASNTVYSLSANSGCQFWSFRSDAPVRTAITIGRGSTQGKWIAYFGDQGATVYAVDALTGELVWKRKVDTFLGATMTGAPTLADGTLYAVTSSGEEAIGANPKYECCKFRGSVSALDALTGEVRWRSFTIPEGPKPVRMNTQGVQLYGPSGAGIWSSPRRASATASAR